MESLKIIRFVALFEAAKGALVLLAGLGALSLIHHDVQRYAELLVSHLHLNPAKHFPHIFIEAATHLTDIRLWILSAFAALYGAVRLIEAFGLWHKRRWAEWFAAISGSIYVPFELYKLYSGATWLSLSALLANILIVALMVNTLLKREPR